ncbi:hypothetical protein BG015_008445, partial [Linnemannia schmuckeri]
MKFNYSPLLSVFALLALLALTGTNLNGHVSAAPVPVIPIYISDDGPIGPRVIEIPDDQISPIEPEAPTQSVDNRK